MKHATPRIAPAAHRLSWRLDPSITYLNHGSFGACPTPVLQHQQALRDQLEGEAVRFMVNDLEPLLDASIDRLATFLNAPAGCIVPVPNATTGVNAVLRSLDLSADDELLVTDHEYNACRNVLDFVAERAGAKVVVVNVPFPLSSPDQVTRAILGKVTPQTRLALIDHITSQTALVFPIKQIVDELRGRGVETLVDAAHAPGSVPIDLTDLNPAYYTGNCHKWMCCPKGAGFLYVREDLQPTVRPAVISHGMNSKRTDRSRFFLEFTWTGTDDPTPFLCIPEALDHMESLHEDGWPGIMATNHTLALRARDTICNALCTDPPAPDDMIPSMASIPLPNKTTPLRPTRHHDDLQDRLIEAGFQVPIIPWPALPNRLIRLSAQLYNTQDQYEALAPALTSALRDEASPN